MQQPVLDDAALRRVLGILIPVVFLSVITGTMVSVALPVMGKDLGADEATYQWVVTGFTVTFGIFSATHGRLADVIGMRRLYLIGVVWFSVLSLLAALSPTIEVVIAVRTIQGAGAAAIPSLGSAIISRCFPAHRRGTAMGTLLGVVGLAASIGPFLGGAIAQFAHWRVVLGVTFLALPFAVLGLRWLPRQLDERGSSRFDVVGALLLGLGTAALMLSFNAIAKGGLGWSAAAWIGGGLALLGAFAVWILRSSHPFVRPGLFADRTYLATTAAAFLTGATRMGTVVMVPIVIIDLLELPPVTAGLVLLPGALLITVVSPMSGRWSDRMGCRIPVAAGLAAVLAGSVLTAVFTGWSTWGIAGGMTLYGFGFACTQSPLLNATSKLLRPQETGVGMGMFMMIFFIGGASGIALSITALTLQSEGAASWIGLHLGGAERHSNAILLMAVLALLGGLLVPFLPGKERTAAPSQPVARAG